jgi:hypothetical protein
VYKDASPTRHKGCSHFNIFIKYKCIKIPWGKIKGTRTINVIGKLVDLMLGKLIIPKHLDPGIPLVNVHIKKNFDPE